MNVSMQDGFNLGWKLGYVLVRPQPREPAGHVLRRASGDRAEPHRLRQGVVDAHGEEARGVRRPGRARGLLRPDRRVPRRLHDPVPAVDARRRADPPGARHRASRSASASSPPRWSGSRDANPVHLGHHHRADGRWRIYAFADARARRRRRPLADWAEWMAGSPDSPVVAHTPAGRRRRRRLRRQGRLPAARTSTSTSPRCPTLFLPARRAVRAHRLREGLRRRPRARTSSTCAASTAPAASSWSGPTSTSRQSSRSTPPPSSPRSSASTCSSRPRSRWPDAPRSLMTDNRQTQLLEAREAELLANVPDGLFIGGEWRAGERGAHARRRRPRDRARSSRRIADASPADGLAALDAACDAFPAWAATPARERGELLRRAFDLLQERKEDVRAPHDDRDGQAARRGARRGRLRRGVPALVQRGGRRASRAATGPTPRAPDA